MCSSVFIEQLREYFGVMVSGGIWFYLFANMGTGQGTALNRSSKGFLKNARGEFTDVSGFWSRCREQDKVFSGNQRSQSFG